MAPTVEIGLVVPSTATSVGHITLPAGSFVASATVSFQNRSGSEILVACSFLSHSPYLDVKGNTGFYDAGVITLQGIVRSGSQQSYDLSCQSSNGDATTVGGEITAVEVDAIYNLG